MDVFTLVAIAELTGLPLSRLRYTLDHRLLPGTEHASRGHRVTRTFTELEALGIACAAALLHGGVRQPLVRQCMAALSRPGSGRRDDIRTVPLEQARRRADASRAIVEIADGAHWRLRIDPSDESNWLVLRPGVTQQIVEPAVVVRLGVGRLRDAIQASRPHR